MTTSRKKYTQKFKDDAVELFLTSDRPIVQVDRKSTRLNSSH